MRYIQDKYLPQYLQIDGNYLDKIGTGKTISIMYSGFDKRTSLITDSIGAIVRFSISFISGFYFSAKL